MNPNQPCPQKESIYGGRPGINDGADFGPAIVDDRVSIFGYSDETFPFCFVPVLGDLHDAGFKGFVESHKDVEDSQSLVAMPFDGYCFLYAACIRLKLLLPGDCQHNDSPVELSMVRARLWSYVSQGGEHKHLIKKLLSFEADECPIELVREFLCISRPTHNPCHAGYFIAEMYGDVYHLFYNFYGNHTASFYPFPNSSRVGSSKKGSILYNPAINTNLEQFIKPYTVRGNHPNHITVADYQENVSGVDVDWKIYWMPTSGYCTKMAFVFYDVVEKRELTIDNMSIVSLIRTPIFDKDFIRISKSIEAEDDTATDQEKDHLGQSGDLIPYVQYWLAKTGSNNIEDPTIPLKKFQTQASNYGYSYATVGQPGLVLCTHGNLLHVGVKTHYEPPKNFSSPASWCTFDVMKSCGVDVKILNVYKDFVYAYRGVMGGNDRYVEIAEWQYFMSAYKVGYRFWSRKCAPSDTPHINPSPLEEKDARLESNVNFSSTATVSALLCNEHWVSVIIPNEKPLLLNGLRKNVEKITITAKLSELMNEWPGSVDCVRQKLNTQAECVIVANWTGVTQTCIYGSKYYKYDSNTFVDAKNSKLKYFYYEFQEDLVIDQHIYRSVHVETHSSGLELTVMTKIPIVITEFTDVYGGSVKVRTQPRTDKEQVSLLEEWQHMEGRAKLIRNDVAASVNSAYTFIKCKSNKPICKNWILYENLQFALDDQAIDHNFCDIAKGRIFVQNFKTSAQKFIVSVCTKPSCKIVNYFKSRVFSVFQSDEVKLVGAIDFSQCNVYDLFFIMFKCLFKILANFFVNLFIPILFTLFWFSITCYITAFYEAYQALTVATSTISALLGLLGMIVSVFRGLSPSSPDYLEWQSVFKDGCWYTLYGTEFMLGGCFLLAFMWIIYILGMAFIISRTNWFDEENPVGAIVAELSTEKKQALLKTSNFVTTVLVKVKAYWNGVEISVNRLVREFYKGKSVDTGYVVSSKVPIEYQPFLHKIAPNSQIAGLWSFLLRACKPPALPKPEVLHMFSNNVHIHRLIDDINSSDFLISWVDYLKHVLKRKKALYQRGFDQFMKKPIIRNVFNILVKWNEKQHPDELTCADDSDAYKGRNLFNPSESVKAICGWIANIILHRVKYSPHYGPGFACGLSPEELEDRMTASICALKKRYPGEEIIAFEYDGKQWDSCQHPFFMEAVDNTIFRATLPKVCRDVGMSRTQTEEIIRFVTCLRQKVRLVKKDKRFPRNHRYLTVLEGVVDATVLSGHPTSTTLMNTVRNETASMVVADRAGLVYNRDVYSFHSGDDAIVFMPACHRSRYEKGFDYVFGEDKYGLCARDAKWSRIEKGEHASFLSKLLWFDCGAIHMIRKCERLVQTGLYSNKVTQEEMPQFDRAITSQIKAWGRNVTGVKSFVRWRNTTDARRISRKVKLASTDEYEVLSKNSRPLRVQDTPNMPHLYKFLDACMGDPTLIWMKKKGDFNM